MSVIASYTKGFRQSIKNPKMLILLYAFNIILALALVFPFYGLLKSSAAETIESKNLLTQFSFSFFVDLLYTSKSAFISLFSQIKWIALLYWILSVFLIGGIIRVISKEKFSVADFFSGSSLYFTRILGANLIITILQISLALIIWIPYYIITKATFDIIDNERVLIILTAAVLIFHMSFFIILMMLNDYSKFHIILNNSRNIFKSILEARKYIFKNFFKVYSLFLMLLLVPIAIFYIYIKLSGDISVNSLFGIFVIFVVQQLFIIMKIWTKVWFYASQFNFYTSDFIKEQKQKLKNDIFETIETNILDIKERIFDRENKTEKEEEAVG